MLNNELTEFLRTWDRENIRTQALLGSLPADHYDFRPDRDGRSLGELAWHLAECEAYISMGVAHRDFRGAPKPPGIARPQTIDGLLPTIDGLLPSFRVIHEDARARVANLQPEEFGSEITYGDGSRRTIREAPTFSVRSTRPPPRRQDLTK